MALQQTVEETIKGLGLELVELERSTGGLLRVTIDYPWRGADQETPAVGIDDCERVSRQLQYALEVENIDYTRLEVSSPGVDRPLRNELDFERFAGEQIDVTLKAPIGAAAAGQVSANRKRFRGQLLKADNGIWQLVWSDDDDLDASKGRGKTGKATKRAQSSPEAEHAMSFELDELASARLVPTLNFRPRGKRGLSDQEGSVD